MADVGYLAQSMDPLAAIADVGSLAQSMDPLAAIADVGSLAQSMDHLAAIADVGYLAQAGKARPYPARCGPNPVSSQKWIVPFRIRKEPINQTFLTFYQLIFTRGQIRMIYRPIAPPCGIIWGKLKRSPNVCNETVFVIHCLHHSRLIIRPIEQNRSGAKEGLDVMFRLPQRVPNKRSYF